MLNIYKRDLTSKSQLSKSKLKDFNTALHTIFLSQVQNFYKQKFIEHSDYTGDFKLDKIKDSFGKELKKYFEEKTGILNPFNHRTLINYVNNGISTNAKNNTLDSLAKFCDFNSYDEFISSSKSVKSIKTWPFFLATVLIVSIGLSVFYLTNREIQKRQIFDVIKKANEEQLIAYKSLPNLRLEQLKKYYSKDGSAFKVIEDILRRSIQKNLTIGMPDDNASYYTLHNLKLIDMEGKRAVLESKEHWYLRWYNLVAERYEKKYDKTNAQVYILNKENGVWKITANDYEGTAEDL